MTSSNNPSVKDTVTLTWTINNFGALSTETCSSAFTAPISNNKFFMYLNTGNFHGMNHIFITLYYYPTQTELPIQYRISILDANGHKGYTREYRWDYHKLDYSHCHLNVTNYISRDKCNELMVNGSLKIFCEVDILAKESVNQLQSQLLFESYGKISDEYQCLFESGKLSDFIVVVGEKEFRVHKAILAARSVVFAAMLEHEKSKEVQDGRVVIADVDVKVFELLLRYIYTCKIPQMDDYASELFVAADIYQLDHLKHICEQTLISALAIDSVSGVLLLADMHNAVQLKSKCIQYMIANSEEVMQTEAWNKLIQANRIDLIAELFKTSSAKSK